MNERFINYVVGFLALLGVCLAAYELYQQQTGGGEAESVGAEAPEASLRVIDSERRVTLEEFEGRVVLLDFWATWCPPCREQMPVVQKLDDDESLADSLEVLSVNTDEQADDPEQKATRFLKKHDYTFTTLLDDGSVADAFGVTQLPTLIVVDPKGHIAYRETGVHTESELRKLIEQAR